MKKYMCIIMASIIVLAAASGAFAVVYGTSGYENYGYSEETAWEIDSVSTLVKFRDDVNSGRLDYEHYVKLTSDLDLGVGVQWTPIGGANNTDKFPSDLYQFKGHFDGCNHLITLNISVSGQGVYPRHHEAGLFGVINGGSVRKLRVSGSVSGGATYGDSVPGVEVTGDGTFYVGGIACILYSGTIENCSFNGNVKLTQHFWAECELAFWGHAGGIVAYAGGSNVHINNCRVGSTSATSISASVKRLSTGIGMGRAPTVGGIAGSLYVSGESSVSGNYVSAQFILNGGEYDDILITRLLGNTPNIYHNVEVDPSEATSVAINSTNFPDAVFREYVKGFDENGDGSLYTGERYSVTNIDVNRMGIYSLKGIEHFPNLYTLFCERNHLTELDVSANTALDQLDFANYGDEGEENFNPEDYNQIQAIDLSKNTALVTLQAACNGIEAIDLSKNVNLVNLDVGGNKLTALDLSNNPEIGTLWCWQNQLTALDVSHLAYLERLECGGNPLRNLNVSGCTNLLYLDCNHNQLTAIDVSKSTALEVLNVGTNQFASVNISSNTNLWFFDCRENPLKGLDITRNTGLTHLYYPECGLPNVDLSKNLLLEHFDCSANGITNLDISRLTNLTILWTYGNQLTALNTSSNAKLEELYCAGNTQLTALDLSGNPVLRVLECNDCQLSSLNVSSNTQLAALSCFNNPISALNVSSNTLLTDLFCDNTLMTTIDVSRNTELTGFHCGGENFTAVNVSSNTKLRDLCVWGHVETLDVSKNTLLEVLQCQWNQLLTLDVSNNPKLRFLGCSNNQLSSLNVSNNPELEELYCNDHYDDGEEIHAEDHNRITALDVSKNTMLRVLRCEWNMIGNLDISSNTALQILDCGGNQIASLNVTNCSELQELYCNQTLMSTVDVSNNPELGTLHCGGENFSALDVTHNAKLESLVVWGRWGQIGTLNVTQNPALRYLDCNGNGLETLDLSSNTLLEELDCGYNALTAIDVSKNVNLRRFHCERNFLTALDVSNNTLLEELDFSNRFDDGEEYREFNRITNIDVSKNSALRYLGCVDNGIETLNVTNNHALDGLDFCSNQLTTIDLSNNPALTGLWCSWNQLTALNLSSNPLIHELRCENNYISTLDVSNLAELYALDCDNNPLTALDLSHNPELNFFRCGENFVEEPYHQPELTSINLANNPKLEHVYLCGNRLTEIDVSNNPRLNFLDLQDNCLDELDVSANPELEFLCLQNILNPGGNQLETLDLSNNNNMKHLQVSGNRLAAINVSNMPMLEVLECAQNYITALDVTQNPNLQELNCSGNSISELNLSNNTKLITLFCHDDMIVALDVSMNIELVRLGCSNNGMTALTLGDKPELVYLDCTGNSLTQVDVSGCPKLDLSNGDSFAYDGGVNIIDGSFTLTITKDYLAAGKVNTAYSDTLTATLSGGSYPITWGATGLPSWLTLNSSTGALTGTPTAAGSYTFTVTAYVGQYSSDPKQFTITVSAGTGTEMPEAEDDPPEFKSHGPVLEGQILIYFYVYMPTLYEDSYVTFRVLNDTTYNPVQDFDPEITTQGKLGTYYGFKCCLTSIQMYDPITATIYYNGGDTVTHTWSFREYLDKYYTSSSSSAPLKKLIGAMKDYGYYAQIALDEIHSWNLGVDHIAAECANVYTNTDIEEATAAVAPYAKSWNVGNSGIKSIGYTLALDSDTTVELYLRPADGYTGNVGAYSRGVIGVTDTNANLAVRQSDGRYLVQISGIPAHRLDYMNTIRVVTDKGEFDIKVSALSYVNTVLTSSKYNDNMKKAVTSLYRYYKATKEYRASTGQ